MVWSSDYQESYSNHKMARTLCSSSFTLERSLRSLTRWSCNGEVSQDKPNFDSWHPVKPREVQYQDQSIFSPAIQNHVDLFMFESQSV
jgi:hypothetical protein